MKLVPVLLIAVFAPVVLWSQSEIDRRLGTFRSQEEVLYLWSGEHVKRLFPGFETLAADLYWLRTVQYFGGQRRFSREKRFELLEPLVDIATTLDPRLEVAYRYGAIFLSEGWPVGAGKPREGIELLGRGVASIPGSWRLRQDYGFFHQLYLGDSERAAAILNEAADLPGAPFWLRTLAADLLVKGGDRAEARRMWQQMYEQAEEGVIKENARVRLAILDSLDLAERLSAAAAEYRRRTGRLPGRLADLRDAGLWGGPLVDAEGTPLAYDPGTGRVSISPRSPLWRPDLDHGGKDS